jgi:hypothetical protein
MTRLASVRVGIAVASLVMAMGGCKCPDNPPSCDNTDLAVSFVMPTDGAMVDPATTVQVALSRRGEAVSIGSAKLAIRGPGQSEFGGSADGMVDGSNATFAVMLAAGQNALRATVSEANCDGNAPPVTITVTARDVVTPPPVIVSCAFPQDANQDGTLNATELPAGTAVQVRVTTMNGAGATFSAPNSSPANAPIMNETATISVPGPTADGTFAVTGTVTRGTNAPTCTPMIRVARARPMCTNTTRLLNGPSEDADPMMAGFQLSVSGTVATSVRTVSFSTSGVAPITAMPVSGAVSGVFTLPAMGDNTYPIRLQGTDVDGNTCDETVMARVDLVAPDLTITSPVQMADGGPAVITATPANLIVRTDADPGSMVCVQRRQGMGTPVAVGCGAVAAGSATVAVPFAMGGAYDLIATVTDLVGNTASRTVSVVVNLMNCGVAFTRPGMCPGFITSAQLPTGTYSFEISSPNCVGNTARLLINGMQVGMDRTIGSNGTVRIDAPLTNGMLTARAEVVNTTGPASFVECDVTVDTNAPAWTNPQPLANMQPTIIGANQDQQPPTPGVQRVLAFNAVVPVGGRASICTTQQTDPVTMTARMPCPNGEAGWYLLADNVASPISAFTFPNGTYSLRVVVTTAGVSNESADLPVIVDAVRPCVLANSVTFPQDANSDGVLNAAELGTNAPRLSFRLDPACGVSDLTGLQSVVVRRILTGAVDNSTAFNLPADVGVNAGVVTVSLSQNITDTTTQFFVQLTKNVSLNQNLYTGMMDPATRSIRIDRSPPTCVFTAPSGAGPFGNGAVPGGMLAATIQTSNDVPSVNIVLGGPIAQNATPMVQSATNTATASFPVTGDNMWTLDATCTDTAGNSTPATRLSFRVDLIAPTCTVTSPATGSSHTTTPPNTSIAVVGADGQPVVITSSLSGAMPLGSPLTVMAGVAQSAAVPYENSATPQTITAAVSDTAGNSTTCSSTNVTINTTNCNLTLTGVYTSSAPAAPPPGSWVNLGNSTPSGMNRTFVFGGVSSNCVGREARISRTIPVTMPHLQSVTIPTGGSFSFAPITVVDGEQYAIGVDNGSGVITALTIGVDLSAPTINSVTMNTRDVTSATSLSFVASGLNNRNVELNVLGYVPDLNTDPANADVDIAISAVGSQSAMFPGRVTLSFTGQMDAVAPLSGTMASFNGRQYVHGSSGTLALTILEPTGNTTTYSKATAVDVRVPGAPTVVASFATPNVSNRRGEVTLTWAPTGDDGDVSTGAHAGYEVRWTTDSVLPSGNKLATPMDYFGSSSKAESDSAWSATNTSRVITLPPLNTYYIAVRAKDEVGNYSVYVAPPTAGFANLWTPVTLTGPAGAAFGRSLATEGSLDNDNIFDVVVGAPSRNSSNGAVFIYSGASALGDQSTCAVGCQEITPPDTVGREFGWDVSTAGNVGDVASEAKNDLLIAQRGSASVTGRAFLYFGSTSGTIATTAGTYVLFRGDLATDRFASATKIIKSIDGDALDEVMINAHNANGGRGRVYIFKGRSRAAWLAASTGTEPVTNAPFVPTSAADWVFDGPMDVSLPTSGVAFGLERFGMGSVGDFNNDGRNDFVIPAGLDSIGRVQLYSAAQVSPDGGSVAGPIATTAAFTTLQGTTSTSNSVDGFGTRVVGTHNLLNGTERDLLVSRPAASSVYFFADFSPSGVAGCPPNSGTPCSALPSFTLTGGGSWGANFTVGNLNGDLSASLAPLTDIVVSEGQVANNRAWVVYQQANSFNSPVGTGVPQFWVSLFQGSALGRTLAIADVTGDANPDLVLGDYIANNIRIWR